MGSRAKMTVFWPGITADIEEARAKCRACHRNAPSQAKLPPMEPRIPKFPFEMLYSDYFKLKGHWYLIIGDRLSGWTEIYRTKVGSHDASGSRGLCNSLRRVFATFGVPDDPSSDQGAEFTVIERSGVNHTFTPL